MSIAAFTPFTLSVPATSANLGPGFDTVGMALGLFNRFTVQPSDIDQLTIDPASTEDTTAINTHPADNLFFQAMDAYAASRHCHRPTVHVDIQANIPLARGLGSSSSVIVAGLLAATRLTGLNETPKALLALATTLEGHPDNVAPALLGGVQWCRQPEAGKVHAFALPWPNCWRVLVAIPAQPLSTHAARQALPPAYTLTDAVANIQAAGLLVHALHTADEHAMTLALTDCIHQPYRTPLIPGFEQVAQLAQQAGAMGTVISGAGSTMAIIVASTHVTQVGHALHQWISRQDEKAYKQLELPVLV